MHEMIDPLRANPTKWPNTLTTIRRLLQTNYLRVFEHFVGLELKGLISVFPLPIIMQVKHLRKAHVRR